MSEKKSVKVGKTTLHLVDKTDPVWDLFKVALKDSDNYETIADAKFEIVLVEPCISKRTVARIRRSSPLLKLFNNCDYLIEFSSDMYDNFTDEVRRIVLEHELDHAVGIENEKTGTMVYRTVDHDFKDFYSIIKKYGMNWLDELQRVAVANEVKIRQNKNGKEDIEISKERAEAAVKIVKL